MSAANSLATVQPMHLAQQPVPEQPKLLALPAAVLNVAVGSLALGGAEYIVLQWAARAAVRHGVRLLVLRDASQEWPIPAGIEITRLGGVDIGRRLEMAGARLAADGNRIVLCHMLLNDERSALARGGALPIPVLHNASAGWLEPGRCLAASGNPPFAIAVSQAAAAELRVAAPRLPCAVVRYLPRMRTSHPDARRDWRMRWALREDTIVIGMAGGVKPQKAYPRALRVLAALRALPALANAHLVILGGPTGRDGLLAWRTVLEQTRRLALEAYVRLPGFVPQAAQCFAAFDLFLNTSRYEGLSIATLEALVGGLPVVASRVGGQGEISSPGLTLVGVDETDESWASAVAANVRTCPAKPDWSGFPSDRLWTLFHLAEPFDPCQGARPRVLFVTANLNAGGAQRSLVNLAQALIDRMPFEIVVCGNSTASHFTQALHKVGVPLRRSADSTDVFDHVEALVRFVIATRPAVMCFWNVDPKIKLLLVKVLGTGCLRFIDVSPGEYAFEEMRSMAPFQQWIAFAAEEYYQRLSRLVLKYRATEAAGWRGSRPVTAVIPNGVVIPVRQHTVEDGMTIYNRARIVMSGRLAPSKFLLETISAMARVWASFPDVELHLLGTAEPRHAEYAAAVLRSAGDELGRRVLLHGAAFDAPERLAEYDLALVLGEHQGCPNSVLEALAAGLPVVANDSGGTREQVLHGKTGILLRDREPATIAAGLLSVLSNPALARRLSRRGRAHVTRRFSMAAMANAYLQLFDTVAKERQPC
jgi:glycosyltransferase involved in cell wall biosynthesis